MSVPIPGSSIVAYCDCANKKRDESNPVVAAPVNTTWTCKCEYLDKVSTRIFSSIARFQYYWVCLNCGKKRLIGVWDTDGSYYGS